MTTHKQYHGDNYSSVQLMKALPNQSAIIIWFFLAVSVLQINEKKIKIKMKRIKAESAKKIYHSPTSQFIKIITPKNHSLLKIKISFYSSFTAN